MHDDQVEHDDEDARFVLFMVTHWFEFPNAVLHREADVNATLDKYSSQTRQA